MTRSSASVRIERALRQRLMRAFAADFAVPPRRILAGFSGGPDSLALAILLKGIERAIEVPIVLLHVDHRLRPDSAEDAVRCRVIAESIELPIETVRVSGDPRTLHPGEGLEEGARRERYRAFAALAESDDVIALAHHSGDQTETVLLHLLHGAGIHGLSGMQRLASLDVPWWGESVAAHRLRIWRPLLAEHRGQLRNVVDSYSITPLSDPSNDDPSIRRNALRQQVLPVLRAFEPSFDDRIGTLSAVAATEDAYIESEARRVMMAASALCGGLSLDYLLAAPQALRRRVVRTWLTRHLRQGPSFDRVEAVIAMAECHDHVAAVEAGSDKLVGIFGSVLRCGSLAELKRHAWIDSQLVIPLITAQHRLSSAGATFVLSSDDGPRTGEATRCLDREGVVRIEPVRAAARRLNQQPVWDAWFREQRISPWIRDDVQGVTVDGRVWWIPRVGDCDDCTSGRLIRLTWSEQERT